MPPHQPTCPGRTSPTQCKLCVSPSVLHLPLQENTAANKTRSKPSITALVLSSPLRSLGSFSPAAWVWPPSQGSHHHSSDLCTLLASDALIPIHRWLPSPVSSLLLMFSTRIFTVYIGEHVMFSILSVSSVFTAFPSCIQQPKAASCNETELQYSINTK